ncbi:FixH family protein [Brevibacillus dissolubilis]|uniref:FixH family protein n=1 Tax=Brevibacillus dissolubilis TaxID=1844116 RepID=UPI0011179FEB|nr:FixH family protein [Brevibacillus dissolubilis]
MKKIQKNGLLAVALVVMTALAGCGADTDTAQEQHHEAGHTDATGQADATKAEGSTEQAPASTAQPASAQPAEAHPHHDATTSTAQHGHGGQADIQFLTTTGFKANQAAAMSVQLMSGHDPITGAKVKFEYWIGEEQKHTFVDAAEGDKGAYSAQLTLAKGEYHVVAHAEKAADHLHDHKEMTLKVE